MKMGRRRNWFDRRCRAVFFGELMQWKGANRLYSKRSLQQWVDRLEEGWE